MPKNKPSQEELSLEAWLQYGAQTMSKVTICQSQWLPVEKKCVNLVSPSAVQCLKPTLSKHVLFSKFEFINQHLIQTFVSTYYAGSII